MEKEGTKNLQAGTGASSPSPGLGTRLAQRLSEAGGVDLPIEPRFLPRKTPEFRDEADG
ncbi:MAG: hypothetical protein VX420_08440 [SAR324 cluster bacterium]|nr:hypothetical protein [SAR324 cluster bacterium]